MQANASLSLDADQGLASARRWVSAHLHYHDGLDNLLCSGVRPLVDELIANGLIEGFFFVRYWQGGQHVRLRVLPTDEINKEHISCLIETRIGQFFTRSPSQAIIRSEHYARAAAWLCQQEFGQRTVTIEPLQPNNCIRYVAYSPEYGRCGGPAGVAAFEPHFMDSSKIALELIATNPSPRQRTGRALALMLLAAAVAVPDLQRLARFFRTSYRNWADRLVTGDRVHPKRYETEFERHYDRQRPQIDDLVRQLLEVACHPGGDDADAISARWMASIAVLRDRLDSLAPDDQRMGLEPLLFQALHKHNNRLGVPLIEETYLLFLLQRTLTKFLK
jgi:thiopeptide-type bacteriocin biosynthesis protein